MRVCVYVRLCGTRFGAYVREEVGGEGNQRRKKINMEEEYGSSFWAVKSVHTHTHTQCACICVRAEGC